MAMTLAEPGHKPKPRIALAVDHPKIAALREGRLDQVSPAPP
jgi:hypothetical protein